MTERRIIKFQNTRIQVPVDTMFTSPGEYGLYCLPIDGAQALARIAPYLDREVTYVDEVIDERLFYGPYEADLYQIRDLLGELEVQLMSPCDFSPIVTELQAIASAVNALQCVCSAMTRTETATPWGGLLPDYLDSGQAYPGYELPEQAVPSQSDPDSCGIAQLYWAVAQQTLTETLLPAAASTFDTFVPILYALVQGWTTGPAAILPAYGVAETVQELLELGYAGSQENLVNWLYGVKQDWVCLVYNMLQEGTSDKAISQALRNNIIYPAEDLSPGDKLAVAFCSAQWAFRIAKQAWADQTVWAIQNSEPGYCDPCDPYPENCTALYPCNLSDWILSIPGVSLICNGDYPQCRQSWSRYTAGIVQVPSTTFWIKIWWIPRSPSAPTATADFDVYLQPGDIHKPLYPTAAKPKDVLTSDTYQVTGATLGKTVQLQVIQAGWYFDIVEYCVYDYNPDI